MGLEHLILMRHAKSSWQQEALSDHERPLNERGRRAAAAIGGVLRAKQLMPRLIWSSDSKRTRETTARLLNASQDCTVKFLPEFYHAPANKVLYVCAQKEEPHEGPLLLMGHNPGWEDLFFHFSGLQRRFPTGACAVYSREDHSQNWLDKHAWQLADFILPRDLER